MWEKWVLSMYTLFRTLRCAFHIFGSDSGGFSMAKFPKSNEETVVVLLALYGFVQLQLCIIDGYVLWKNNVEFIHLLADIYMANGVVIILYGKFLYRYIKDYGFPYRYQGNVIRPGEYFYLIEFMVGLIGLFYKYFI